MSRRCFFQTPRPAPTPAAPAPPTVKPRIRSLKPPDWGKKGSSETRRDQKKGYFCCFHPQTREILSRFGCDGGGTVSPWAGFAASPPPRSALLPQIHKSEKEKIKTNPKGQKCPKTCSKSCWPGPRPRLGLLVENGAFLKKKKMESLVSTFACWLGRGEAFFNLCPSFFPQNNRS